MGFSLGGLGGIIGGIGGFMVGGPTGAAIGASIGGGLDTNEANAKQAAMNREFQADQSGTAYQRAVADMKAANLNPMLAYGQGGASTPAGSTATMENVMTPAVSSALQTSRLKADLVNLQQQTDNLKANEKKIIADTISSTWANAKMKADITNSTAQTASQIQLNRTLQLQAAAQAAAATSSAKKLATDTKLSEAALPKAQNQAGYSKTGTGQFLDAIEKVMDSFSPFGHSAGAISK